MNNNNLLISSDQKFFQSVVSFVLLCLVVFPIFGAIYAFIIRGIAVYFYTGAVIIIPWIAAFFGYCIGYIIYIFVFNNNSFYNSKQQFFMVLTVLIIAYYFHWLIWVTAVTSSSETWQSQMFILLSEPKMLLKSIVDINASGTWHIDEAEGYYLGATKGMILYVFWFCELLLMTIYPFFVAQNKDNKKTNQS